MEESKKIKSLWLAILGLIIINISILGWIGFGNSVGHPPNESIPPYEIPTRLGFDESQKMAFENIKEEHFRRVRPVRDHIRMLKENLWEDVKNDVQNDSLLKAQIAILSNEIQINEYETFKHLQDIRKICTTSQRRIFDSEIVPLFNRKEPPHPNKRNKRK